MRSRFLAALVLAAFLGGCDSDDNTGPDEEAAARLRLVHASAGSPAVDLLVDGDRVAAGVAFENASQYVEVAGGAHAIELRAAGGSTVLASLQKTIADSNRYTIFFNGPAGDAGTIVTLDSARVPATGKAKIRVVHAAKTAVPLDVYLTGADESLDGASRLVFPFPYGTGLSDEFPGYVEREPGAYRVRFTAEGTKDVLVDTHSFQLLAGEVRSALLADSLNGKLTVTVLHD